jgi:hypothetical protein
VLDDVLVQVIRDASEPEIPGLQVTCAEDGAGSLAFFRDPAARGRTGVQLVTAMPTPVLVTAAGATLSQEGSAPPMPRRLQSVPVVQRPE